MSEVTNKSHDDEIKKLKDQLKDSIFAFARKGFTNKKMMYRMRHAQYCSKCIKKLSNHMQRNC